MSESESIRKKVPAGDGESLYTEKRSQFLGHVRKASTEDEARAFIAEVKKNNRDARHNCWAYIIDQNTFRYSDDGEPQGTAGIPMLEVLRREGVSECVCVVTRYFGGVLLGAGGLLRAYTKACKDALDDAGTEEIREKSLIDVSCPYSLFEKLKYELTPYEALIKNARYGEAIELEIEVPLEKSEDLQKKIKEIGIY